MQEDHKDQYMDFIELAVHDLDAPLRKLNVFVDRLADKYADKTELEAKGYMRRIGGCVSEMRSLIDSLAMLARLKADEEKFVPCDTRMIAEEVIRELQEVIRDTKTIVTLTDLPVLNGDVSQYGILFRLLLENAIKFTIKDEPPVIEISSRELSRDEKEHDGLAVEETYFRISIADNGIGLDTENKQKIFDPLVRLHGKSEFAGNGLGLAMCKRIVDNHRGRIYAESKEQSGARFILIMPANPNAHVKR
jgi:signal transduction histidine kinase